MSHFGKLCLAAGLLLPPAAQAEDARPYDKASFYFAAHGDDWQLFMNPSAFLDVAGTRTKTVFVHVTAGDAGSGLGRRGRKHPFYLARENGAEAAIRFMADANEMPVEKVAGHKTFNGHPIYRVSYRNTVSYFLRVPDGNGGGSGYPETGNESLRRLSEGQPDRLRAIDGSTVYRGWGDLTATLRALIDYERADAPAVQINVGETDPAINPGDHSDHLMTAKAALDAAKNLVCARRLYFVDYASARLPENLDPKQRDMETAVFAVTAAGIRALDHSSAWHHYNDSYVGRNYFRVEEGTGRCDASHPEIAATPQKTAAAARQQLAVAKPK
jgi:hypothetical protein